MFASVASTAKTPAHARPNPIPRTGLSAAAYCKHDLNSSGSTGVEISLHSSALAGERLKLVAGLAVNCEDRWPVVARRQNHAAIVEADQALTGSLWSISWHVCAADHASSATPASVVVGSPRLNITRTKASTTAGSKCVPRPASM
jgi:hypothetical protein